MTAEERQEILELVAGGKLSAAEAATLLASNEDGETKPEANNSIEVEEVLKAPQVAESQFETGGKKATWLHVRVSDLNTGKRKVTVNIPLRLMKLGMRLGSAFTPELKDVDVDELSHVLESDGKGVLVDVEDEEDGTHVQVYVD